MSEIRNDYINQLLHELGSLEERLLSLRDSGTLPFSFFRESFDQTREISRLLHELELLQIEGMKQQMEKLVQILSEAEQKNSSLQEETASVGQKISDDTARNQHAEGFTWPEYKNPRSSEMVSPAENTEKAPQLAEKNLKPVIPPLNDKIRATPTLLDMKRSISLNDRFLFQRELFHNNREEMNQVMVQLNAFDDFSQAENYLRGHYGWDLDNPVVEDFLKVIKKGFA